ncbi:CRAL trio domain-containing protein [Cyclospora cayetanensis]|uniref:CRAL trio domain-containing protein n=1 Tax=Cyclospora cayetanensis TaxID=88456 RepID=A0A1D3CR14_9EIME|nr:CRAL trio domain-containing protein [Cyclospora cayetanensis]
MPRSLKGSVSRSTLAVYQLPHPPTFTGNDVEARLEKRLGSVVSYYRLRRHGGCSGVEIALRERLLKFQHSRVRAMTDARALDASAAAGEGGEATGSGVCTPGCRAVARFRDVLMKASTVPAEELPEFGWKIPLVTSCEPSPFCIPQEVFTFKPQETDIYKIFFMGTSKEVRIRQIFFHTPLTPEEQQWLVEFREHCRKSNWQIPLFLEPMVLRIIWLAYRKWGDHIITRSFDLAKAMVEWREGFFPLSDREEEMRAMLDKGVMFWVGRDRHLRPLLLIKLARLSKTVSPEAFKRLTIFCFEWGLRYLSKHQQKAKPARQGWWALGVRAREETPGHLGSQICCAQLDESENRHLEGERRIPVGVAGGMTSLRDVLLAYLHQFVCVGGKKASCLIPGVVETITVLLDVRGVPLHQFPISALTDMTSTLTKQYPFRLNRMLIINDSFFVQTVWNIAKQFLTEVQQQKMLFFRTGFEEELMREYTPWQLEKCYGGTRPEITEFYPFPIAPGPYTIGSEQRADPYKGGYRATDRITSMGVLWEKDCRMPIQWAPDAFSVFKDLSLPPPESVVEATVQKTEKGDSAGSAESHEGLDMTPETAAAVAAGVGAVEAAEDAAFAAAAEAAPEAGCQAQESVRVAEAAAEVAHAARGVGESGAKEAMDKATNASPDSACEAGTCHAPLAASTKPDASENAVEELKKGTSVNGAPPPQQAVSS